MIDLKIAIIPNLTRSKAAQVTAFICAELQKLGIDFVFGEETKRTLSQLHGERAYIKDIFDGISDICFEADGEFIRNSDMVISVGGDGSMLRAAKLAAKENKNILGINAGRLAYLCGLNDNELNLLSCLKDKNYTVQSRMMLTAEVFFKDECVYTAECLNDAVFSRGANPKIIDLSVKTGGRHIVDYLADGAIFATPTGSTAYSMSAGGAVVEPTLEAVLLTPVCPHSIAVRPYIFSGDSEFEISVKNTLDSENEVYFSCDGETPLKIDGDYIVKIKKSEMKASFVSIKTDNFIDVLNKKLENKK